jgi:2-polyprenyl-3-methyl-5-hydroxy-6-metoxy-1,4-benzoquinol methylase
MTIKEHYDNHLGYFYSWMIGDLTSKQTEFQDFLIEQKLLPQSGKIAIDLGAGNGIQTVSLAKSGYFVKSIDFNKQLLEELTINTKGLNVEIINTDIRNFNDLSINNPELIICWGDTIAHLDSEQEILQLITTISKTLSEGGKFLLSFRDYSVELTGENRFIPIKSDENKILTCILDYQPEYVIVTDLLHEKIGNSWKQKVSFYKKVRVTTEMIVKIIEQTNMKIQFNQIINGMTTTIADKK